MHEARTGTRIVERELFQEFELRQLNDFTSGRLDRMIHELRPILLFVLLSRLSRCDGRGVQAVPSPMQDQGLDEAALSPQLDFLFPPDGELRCDLQPLVVDGLRLLHGEVRVDQLLVFVLRLDDLLVDGLDARRKQTCVLDALAEISHPPLRAALLVPGGIPEQVSPDHLRQVAVRITPLAKNPQVVLRLRARGHYTQLQLVEVGTDVDMSRGSAEHDPQGNHYVLEVEGLRGGVAPTSGRVCVPTGP